MSWFDDVVKKWRGEAAKQVAAHAARSAAERAMRAVERVGDELLGTGEVEPLQTDADERAERVRKTQETANRRLAERERAKKP